jgi:RES domain
MDLFRVFDWDGASLGRSAGGPLYVARGRQGAGRHDAPAKYGAWYCSRSAVSAVAEAIKFLQGQTLEESDLVRPDGTRRALARLTLDRTERVVDLDDPRVLAVRRLRPSQVATRNRVTTQRIAASIFDAGATGFLWWSTLEAAWTNATLFYERAITDLALRQPPVPLTPELPEVRQAAESLGIEI